MSVSAQPDHLGSTLRGFQNGTERWNPDLDSMKVPSNKPSSRLSGSDVGNSGDNILIPSPNTPVLSMLCP
jgi:hypothetical protein